MPQLHSALASMLCRVALPACRSEKGNNFVARQDGLWKLFRRYDSGPARSMARLQSCVRTRRLWQGCGLWICAAPLALVLFRAPCLGDATFNEGGLTALPVSMEMPDKPSLFAFGPSRRPINQVEQSRPVTNYEPASLAMIARPSIKVPASIAAASSASIGLPSRNHS